MEKPINFLTARGATMLEVAGVARSMTQMLEYVRDQTLAAAEAKVRGECAEDIEAMRCKYDEAVADFLHAKARAERAEAERDAAIRQRNEKQATIGLLRVANQEWQVKLADAKKEELDAYRTAVRDALVAEMVAGVENVTSVATLFGNLELVTRKDVLTYLHGLAPETDNGKL